MDCSVCAKPTKCCAFQPYIPNFLIGGWLEKTNAAELPKLKTAYWHPIGLIPGQKYKREHSQAAEPGASLSCAFFGLDSRKCSLYEFRPSECRIYYCDDARDSLVRKTFTQMAFDEEIAVAQMAMLEMDLTRREMSEQVDLVNQGAVADFAGRDLIFMYKKAWKWSQTVRPRDIKEWMT